MIKTLARSIREYKKPAILTPLLVTIEVILECIIPFSIANLVNQMQAGCGMDVIVKYGIQLVITAILSLIFGVAAGNTCATASTALHVICVKICSTIFKTILLKISTSSRYPAWLLV